MTNQALKYTFIFGSGILVVATVWLWMAMGTSVFVAKVLSGLAQCF